MNTKKIIALSTAAAVTACGVGGTVIYKRSHADVMAQEIEQEIVEAGEIAAPYHSLTSGKNETVYVISDGNGSRTTYVSSWLRNPGGDAVINDVSDLSDIEVVRGAAELSSDDQGQITWNANGDDVYYRGISNDALPVDVNVTYQLDGAAVTEEELQGKSGHLTIDISYENNMSEQVISEDGAEYTIYMPFVMTTGMLLDNGTYSNIEVTNGEAVNDGERTYVIGIGFPGLYESLGLDSIDLDDPIVEESIDQIDIPSEVIIECDVNDYEDLSVLTVASVLNLDNIETSVNTTEVEENLDEITDGMRSLVDGSEQLYEGVSALNEGAVVLNSGASAVSDGAASLASGANALSAGTSELAGGATALQNGISQVNDGAAALNAGLAQVQNNIPALQNGVNDLNNGASQLSQGATTLSTGVDTLYSQLTSDESQAGITALVEGSQTFATSLSALNEALSTPVSAEQAAALQNAIAYLTAYSEEIEDPAAAASISALINAYSTMAASLTQVSASVSALNTAYADINGGIVSLSGKFSEVATAVASIQSGASSLATGASQVSTGLNTLNNSTSTLANGISQLSTGASSLNNGTSQLVTGAQSLSSGVSEVNDGAQALATGAASLSSGANDLANGTAQLADGVGALLDGAGRLEEGLNEFNDQAVDRLTDLINNLVPVSDRIEALKEYSTSYESFSGTPSGVEDSVVFVFKS